jgi:hypothetical protein
MKALRLFSVAILLLIPEVALSQEYTGAGEPSVDFPVAAPPHGYFDYLPLEVGNWWRYELTYTGSDEPFTWDFPSEANLSIDGVVRLDTSAISVAGEVEELPVSADAEISYLVSGSLLRFAADNYQRWAEGQPGATPMEEVLLRWRSRDDLGLWSSIIDGDVVLLGGWRHGGQRWYIYPSPWVFWVPGEERSVIIDVPLGIPHATFTQNFIPESGYITTPVGRFHYLGFHWLQTSFDVITHFARDVGIISVALIGTYPPIKYSYDLVEARVGSTYYGPGATAIPSRGWAKVKGGSR